MRSLVERRAAQRLAVLLHDAGSINKVTQTLVEMVRGGISDIAIDVTVFYEGEPLDRSFVASLPFQVRTIAPGTRFEEAVRQGDFDYVMLFESSGMYRGEDLAVLASHLVIGRLDAVWGSRRLSVRDIEESIRFRYQKSPLFGALSAVGSHVLSLACLTLYGRYISDTLSGVRAIRADDCAEYSRAVDAQTRESASAGAAAAAQGGDPGDPGAVLPDLSRTCETHQRRRWTGIAGRARERTPFRARRIGSIGPAAAQTRHRTSHPTSGGPLLPQRADSEPLLIIPAAGAGSRLQTSTPKFLVPVSGRPMIEWLVDLYRPYVSRIVLIVEPSVRGRGQTPGGRERCRGWTSRFRRRPPACWTRCCLPTIG